MLYYLSCGASESCVRMQISHVRLTQERVLNTCLFTSRRRAAIGYVIVTRQSHKANTAKSQIILLSMAKINHGLVTQ